MHRYYKSQHDDALGLVTAFSMLAIQLLILLISVGVAMLMDMHLPARLAEHSWLLSVLASILISLCSARGFYRVHAAPEKVRELYTAHVTRLRKLFYVSTVWVYPLFSFVYLQQFQSALPLFGAALAIIVLTIVFSRYRVAAPTIKESEFNALGYETRLENYFARVAEKEKDNAMYQQAA